MTVETVPDFSQARVLIVGDVMLDRYWHGATSRISPEAPVPVVHVNHEKEQPGGAGNVALNVVMLGAQPYLLAATGDDAAANTLENHLTAAGVHCHFQRVPGVPTVTKLRVLSRNQQLIRLDFEAGFPGFDYQFLLGQVSTWLSEVGALILSDYGKGSLAVCAGSSNWLERQGYQSLLIPSAVISPLTAVPTSLHPTRLSLKPWLDTVQTNQL